MSNLLKNFPISELAQEFLREFGWSPERSVDLEATYPELFQKIRTDRRFTDLFSNTPKLKPLLKNLSEFEILITDRKIYFGLNGNCNCSEFDVTIQAIKILKEETGRILIDFGKFSIENEGWFILMIDKIGFDIYAISMIDREEWKYMYKLGNIQEALDTLIFDSPPLIHCEKTDLKNADIYWRIMP